MSFVCFRDIKFHVFWVQMLCFLALTLQGVIAYAQSAQPVAFLGVRLDSTSSGQVRISSVLPGSPAEAGGLRRGDLLIELNGQQVGSPSGVVSIVHGQSVGDRLTVRLSREGQRRSVTVTLVAAPGSTDEILRSFVGRPAPTWRLPRVDSAGTVDLASLRGRVVVLYFWSVFCGVCRMSTPVLSSWVNNVFGSQGVSVIALSDDQLGDLQRSQQNSSLGLPLVHDSGSKVGTEYWVNGRPSFFIIDRQGNVAYAGEGWYPQQQQRMESAIRRLLSQSHP